MSRATAPQISSEVSAVFRTKGKAVSWGFDQFLSHKAFTEASNGFRIDGTCVLGAEVFVSKERSKGKGERLSMAKDPVMYKNTWRIDIVSKLDAESYNSKIFIAGDQKWKMQLYPKGKGNGVGTHLAFYLALAEPESLLPGCQIYAEFTLRILDQLNGRHDYGKATHWFSASNSVREWMRFITLGLFKQANMGFVLKDTCIVEADVTVHGITDAL